LRKLQQTCRKIIVHGVKIRNEAGKLRRTVTRCNNHSKRGGIFVLSPSLKKKIAVGQLTLYYWHIALEPRIRKHSIALIDGAVVGRTAACGRCVTIADPRAGFAHSFEKDNNAPSI
jgi:hypothetical protein